MAWGVARIGSFCCCFPEATLPLAALGVQIGVVSPLTSRHLGTERGQRDKLCSPLAPRSAAPHCHRIEPPS